jgi:anti-sigma-K factor RskA
MGVLHPDDLLAAFALEALTPLERSRVAAHLAACTRCQQVVLAQRQALEVLPLALPDLPAPREDLRQRILRAAAQTPQVTAVASRTVRPAAQPGWWRWRSWLVAAALFLISLGLGGRDLALQAQVSQLRAAAGETSLHGVLAPATAAATGAGGQVRAAGGTALVTVVRLPPPTAGHVYEAWVIPPSQAPEAAGTFLTTADGRGALALTRPAVPGDLIAITLEPGAGTSQPTGPVLLKATLLADGS